MQQKAHVHHIDHIGVAVRHLEETIQFMNEVYGAEISEIREQPEHGVRGAMVFFGQTKMELVQPTQPDSVLARFLESRGEGMHHVAFRVDSVQERLEALKAKGFQLVDQEPRRGMFGIIGFVHPSSMHGVLTEFVEPFPQS